MSHTRDITVAAVAESEGRFLIVEERINRRRLFNQPAGHVENGETVLAAVVSEVREETAWRFAPRALLGVYLWRNPATARSVLRFAFTGELSNHDAAQPLDAGIVCTHWFTRGDLEQRAIRLRSPLVLRCVQDYLAGRRHDLGPVAQLDLHGAAAITAHARPGGTAAITAVAL